MPIGDPGSGSVILAILRISYIMDGPLTADETVMLEHFLLEDAMSKPYHHRDNIRLENSGFDRDTNFTWCQFYRPIREYSSQ